GRPPCASNRSATRPLASNRSVTRPLASSRSLGPSDPAQGAGPLARGRRKGPGQPCSGRGEGPDRGDACAVGPWHCLHRSKALGRYTFPAELLGQLGQGPVLENPDRALALPIRPATSFAP